MALSYRTRKRLAIVLLLLALPAYIIVTVTLVNLFDRPPFLLEIAIYVGLGLLWILPLKRLFLGIGLPEPASRKAEEGDGRSSGA